MLNFDRMLEKERREVSHLYLEVDQNADQDAGFVFSDEEVDQFFVNKGVTHEVDGLAARSEIFYDFSL